jgi:coiled-coil domain-containing protein 130
LTKRTRKKETLEFETQTMSSLAAARADNFYRPPPESGVPVEKKQTRSKGAATVIRFEMPCDVTCLGCQLSIAKGVRFNAEKFKVGSYHSTTIWGFRMKSPCCKTAIEIHTNPKDADYEVVSGARKRATAVRREVATGHEATGRDATRAAKHVNTLSRLEKRVSNEKAARVHRQTLEELKERSYDRYGDDVDRNRELRRSMRSARNDVRKRERRRDELGLSKEVILLPETRLDRARAAAVVFDGRTRENTLQKRKKIMRGSIFNAGVK